MDERSQRILDLVNAKDYQPQNASQLAKMLGENVGPVTESLTRLTDQAKLYLNKKGLVQPLWSAGFVAGIFQGSSRGFGFVASEQPGHKEELFIPAGAHKGAMHGDRVLARVAAKSSGPNRAEGEVIKVIERNTKTLVCTLRKGKTHGFGEPVQDKYFEDVFLPGSEVRSLQEGQRIAVEITEYGDGRRGPAGKVAAVFGDGATREANYDSILYAHGIEKEFPPAVLAQAQTISQTVSEEQIAGRLDLRKEQIFTIDGADAKDFDDAVSIVRTANGYALGVHIADVSHYVTADSPLDQEAFKRGTSVYFVDQVVPMLPVALSNGICSLNPDVDRLAFSVLMELDGTGNLLRYDIRKSVIRSCARLIYTDVTKVIEQTDPALSEKYAHLQESFVLMDELAQVLQQRRVKRGAIAFDFPEPKILVGPDGMPTDIVPRERGIADRIIEELMIITNEVVAEHMSTRKMPFVYRIHQSPDPGKIQSFLSVARSMGYCQALQPQQEITPAFVQRMLDEVQDKPEGRMLSTLLLRSMMKAVYSPDCLGHFGLAATYYSHFTSPIRRYPDLAIHRILTEWLKTNDLNERQKAKFSAFSESASLQSSDTEVNAMEAEREIDNLYKALFLKDRVGEEFDGVISTVTAFGFFVELPNTIEGLVRLSDLTDDFYIFEEERLMLHGEHTGKEYRIGDAIRVKVAAVDISTGRIDFDPAEEEKHS